MISFIRGSVRENDDASRTTFHHAIFSNFIHHLHSGDQCGERYDENNHLHCVVQTLPLLCLNFLRIVAL